MQGRIRLARRYEHITALQRLRLLLGGVVVGILAGGAIVVSLGRDPISVYWAMLRSAFETADGFNGVLTAATPLLLTGLAALVAFKSGLYNIGAQGQLYFGAIAASGVSLYVHDASPAILVIASVMAGAAGGILWMAVPAIARVYLGVSEILTTLMLNYIGGFVLVYLIFNSDSFWRNTQGSLAKAYPEGKFIPTGAYWPPLKFVGIQVPLGLLIGLSLCIGMWILYRWLRIGYIARLVGEAPNVATYGGITWSRVALLILITSGGLAGIAGASQIGDFAHSLVPTSLEATNFGYTGILVAVLAMLEPLGIVLAAFGVGIIANAGLVLLGPGFPDGLGGTLEGVILLAVVLTMAGEYYRISYVRADAAGLQTIEDTVATGDDSSRDYGEWRQSAL